MSSSINLRKKSSGLRSGPQTIPETTWARSSTLARRTRFSAILRQASRKDDSSRAAESSGDGYFIQPTVIADVDSKARIFQEEIFGPVLAVTKAENFDHALQLANDSEYGLTGAVYTDNPEKAEKARRQFFVGNLYINRKCTGAMVGAHPFGGFNMSGTDSKAGGPDYLLQFVQAKAIAEKNG